MIFSILTLIILEMTSIQPIIICSMHNGLTVLWMMIIIIWTIRFLEIQLVGIRYIIDGWLIWSVLSFYIGWWDEEKNLLYFFHQGTLKWIKWNFPLCSCCNVSTSFIYFKPTVLLSLRSIIEEKKYIKKML